MLGVTLSNKDLLSLYTEIDEEKDCVKSTRSVIINKTDKNELVVLDNLTFIMFISIPNNVNPASLKKFMVNSYCFSHYENPYGNDNNNSNNNTIVSTTPREKSLYISEKNNNNISDHIKGTLQHIDARNNQLFTSYVNKNKRKYNKYNDHDDEEEDEEHEENNNEDNIYSNIQCEFDEDMNIVQGLYNKKDNGDDDDNNEYYNEEIDHNINTELHKLYRSKDVEKRFPDQKQYKLIFNNHYIMYYFLNRFMRTPITLKNEQQVFNVNVIAYEADPNNIRSIIPLNKLFHGRATEYIESQLYRFKND